MSWDWDKLKDQQHQGRAGGGGPPQMDEFVNQLKKINFPGGPAFIVLVLVAAFLAYSAFFTIESGSVGIIQRFGKFVRIAQPGPNWKWPMGVEKVTKVSQERVYKEEFGFGTPRRDSRGVVSRSGEGDTTSLMLTGDLNVALVPWIVQYRVNDPYDYLFKVKDVDGLLRDMSESTMRTVIGDRSINEVITKRDEIASLAKNLLQKELSDAQAGIQIVTVEMKRTNVPGPVQSSFNEVNQATQEKEKLIYQAKEEYNKAIPAARGEAERTIKGAEGYALERVNQAKGDAARFLSQYNEYVKAKDVTRRRMYLEAMSRLLPKLGQTIIVDENQKNVLPLLNLKGLTGESK